MRFIFNEIINRFNEMQTIVSYSFLYILAWPVYFLTVSVRLTQNNGAPAVVTERGSCERENFSGRSVFGGDFSEDRLDPQQLSDGTWWVSSMNVWITTDMMKRCWPPDTAWCWRDTAAGWWACSPSASGFGAPGTGCRWSWEAAETWLLRLLLLLLLLPPPTPPLSWSGSQQEDV